MSLVLARVPSSQSSGGPIRPTILFITDRLYNSSETEKLVGELRDDFISYVVTTALPNGEEVFSFCEELEEALSKEGVRRLAVVGIGPGASIAQALAVYDPKLVRRVILCDATTRIAPNFFSKLSDRIEKFLPLGLPLRKLSKDFDSRPMLHRVRCPVLVLSSERESSFIIEQANYIAKKIPNAWLDALERNVISEFGQCSDELIEHIKAFIDVPIKRSQKSGS